MTGTLHVLGVIAVIAAAAGCSRFSPNSPTAIQPPGGGAGNPVLAAGFAGVRLVTGQQTGVLVAFDTLKDSAGLPDPNIAYQVFVDDASNGAPFGATPVVAPPGTGSLQIGGLPAGVPVAVGVRAVDITTNAIDSNIAFAIAVPGPVRYCRISAAGGGDGLTPATPFNSLDAAMSSVAAAGGGSVYVTEGNYPVQVRIPDRVALHGGFDVLFDAAIRDPQAHPTVIDGTGQSGTLVKAAPGANWFILDGLTIDGAETCAFGIDVSGTDTNVNFCTVRRCVSKGVRIQPGSTGGLNHIQIHRSAVRDHFGEGIEVNGAVDLQITDTLCSDNFNEGFEAFTLNAPAGGRARIVIRRSNFHRNGNDGIDIKFDRENPADALSSAGARLEVEIDQCVFSENRLTGAKLDIDFSNENQIDARCVMTRSVARGNGLEGIRIDGDARAALELLQMDSSANLGNGFVVSGAPDGAVLRAGRILTLGNLKAGWSTSEGPLVTSACQCTFALDAGGALDAGSTGLTVSNSLLIGGAGSGGFSVYSELINPANVINPKVPVAVLKSTAIIFGTASFAPGHGLSVGDIIEIHHDGVARTVTDADVGSVDFTPALTEIPLTLEAMVFKYAPGGGPGEDLLSTNMVEPAGQGAPGTFQGGGSVAVPGATTGEFRLPSTDSTLSLFSVTNGAGGSNPPLILQFNDTVDATTVPDAPVLLLAPSGALLSATATAAGNTLTITPATTPPAGSIVVVGFKLGGLNNTKPSFPWVLRTAL